ncbi:MAG TPA: glutamate 5-kinase [Firmicutes bacterium]|nr:glutamate 5-kinase [Bacillota bacterium]
MTSKRLVVKVGTSTVTHATGKLNLSGLERVVRQVADVANAGCEVVLVTSGAVGAGLGRLGWQRRPATIPEKQAVAAVGQSLLMQIYEKLFSEYGLTIAQVLLTREDVADRRRYLNARTTLRTLLSYGVVPVINENDTVAVDELKFGDNDTLSALVAGLISADLLIILTDIDGLYTADPRLHPEARLIPRVEEVTPEIEALAGGAGSARGTGGMVTKLAAAKIATSCGVSMVIANASSPSVLQDLLAGRSVGTYFPARERLVSRKRWIAFNVPPAGQVVVDDGARKAVTERGRSLLPSGIVEVAGEFEAGDAVAILGLDGCEFARGLSNYGAADLRRIKGLHSSEIPAVLGERFYEEAVHRDNLVLLNRGEEKHGGTAETQQAGRV